MQVSLINREWLEKEMSCDRHRGICKVDIAGYLRSVLSWVEGGTDIVVDS